MDFEFCEPKEIDFLGLKALLQNYLDAGVDFNSSELCDAIIKQNKVGTVLKAGGAGDVDPIGVMTVIDLSRRGELESLRQIYDVMKQKCPNAKKQVCTQTRFVCTQRPRTS